MVSSASTDGEDFFRQSARDTVTQDVAEEAGLAERSVGQLEPTEGIVETASLGLRDLEKKEKMVSIECVTSPIKSPTSFGRLFRRDRKGFRFLGSHFDGINPKPTQWIGTENY